MDRDQLRHQHGEADMAIRNMLLRYLDRGDVAGVAKDGRGTVAYLANGRDRLLAPDIGSVSGPEVLRRETTQIFENHLGGREADVAIGVGIERAGRPLDAA